MITEASIKEVLKKAKPSAELRDPGARGEGRLTLIIRTTPTRVTSEWYAVWHRDGRRCSAKLGSYPTMSIALARKAFREGAAPALAAGDEPARPYGQETQLATVAALFSAYLDNLVATGKNAAGPRKYLLGSQKPAKGRWKNKAAESAASVIGPTKLAKDVTHRDIIPYLKQIHQRGAVSAAAHARAYVSAAFTFAMSSANSYHQPAGAVDWGVVVNPVAAIPYDPSSRRVGNRHLSPAEFGELWRWLAEQRAISHAAGALMLCMATGQRLTEILCLSPDQRLVDAAYGAGVRLGHFDREGACLYWGKTKGGGAHTIPLPPQAVLVLDTTPVARGGLYFPHRRDPTKPLTISAAEQLITRYLKEDPRRQHFTPRDIRRTWKTLAGAAGISKELRDRLQNHAQSDVSSRHYDRWSYVTEKQAAMSVWSDRLDEIVRARPSATASDMPPLERPVSSLESREHEQA